MAAVDNLVQQGVEQGVYQVILPFVLVFLVMFAILKASKVVEDLWVTIGISLVASVLATLFLSSMPIVGQFLSWFIGKAGIFLIILLIVLVVNAFVRNQVGQ
jgi:hypothetical protein